MLFNAHRGDETKHRSIVREDPNHSRAALDLGRAVDVRDGIWTITLSSAVVARTAGLVERVAHSPDAIHLATAEHVTNATKSEFPGFPSYDSLEAAHNRGLRILVSD